MQLIETHAHIYLEQFQDDIDEVIQKAIETGVDKIYMPNIDHTSIDGMLALEQKYPDHCIPMIGLHPCSVQKNFEKELYLVEEWLSNRSFVAVGEMGTDLHWDKTLFPQQVEAFKVQSALAIQHNVPIVIHCRESIDETIELVTALADEKLRGIFHCFGGSVAQGNQIINQGFVIGIGGIATFKNGGMTTTLSKLPLEKMVLETDSPYLTPVPHRGKRNEPSYLSLVANKIAEVKAISLEKVASTTTATALSVFE